MFAPTHPAGTNGDSQEEEKQLEVEKDRDEKIQKAANEKMRGLKKDHHKADVIDGVLFVVVCLCLNETIEIMNAGIQCIQPMDTVKHVAAPTGYCQSRLNGLGAILLNTWRDVFAPLR